MFDSENDPDHEVLDLHVDVDKGGLSGRCKKARGSGLKEQRVVCTLDYEEDGSTDEDDMYINDEDSDRGIKLKFTSFKVEDLSSPYFKMGMIFVLVEIVRKAILEYSMKSRVEIKMPRNGMRRVRAHCAKGCPWNLYASYDSRARAFMVKQCTVGQNYKK